MTRRSHSGRAPYEAAAPDGCCMACFTAHERYTRPFVVFCPHHGTLVQMTGRRSYRSSKITADELLELVRARETSR